MRLYLIFAGIDYALGLCTALIRGATKKGSVNSSVMTNGIIKKVCCMVLILIAYIVQREMQVDGIYQLVYGSFCISEGLSILEICHENGVKCKPLEHFFGERSDINENDK